MGYVINEHLKIGAISENEAFSLELHPIRLPVGLPVLVSYRPSSVGIFGMVLVLRWG